MDNIIIAVIGMGYVGMPLAIEFSKSWQVIGYDNNEEKISNCILGERPINDLSADSISSCSVKFTTDEDMLKEADILIVTVPTPVKENHIPDLSLLESATKTVGKNMKKGAIVVYESTVFPGTTNEICVPILEEESGYIRGVDFEVGYSPERINVNDKQHILSNITKIVASDDEYCLAKLTGIYNRIINKIHCCTSIAVAEGAKILENCQRDLNIAFMNEMLLTFSSMNISFEQILSAAKTKWNFVDCRPGLVGGHCIGVDPYYMLHRATEQNINMPLLNTARSINENMISEHYHKIISTLKNGSLKNMTLAYLGGTFKEDCSDIRNSKHLQLCTLLRKDFGKVHLVDPYINDENLTTTDIHNLVNINVLVIGAGHSMLISYLHTNLESIFGSSKTKYIFDLSSVLKDLVIDKNKYQYITF